MIGAVCWGGLLFALTLVGLICPGQGVAAPAENVESKAVATEAAQLVKQLSDEEYVVRETAAERLTRLGLAAQEALEAGSKDTDREVRYRCERILAVVRQTDLALRLAAFAGDRDTDNNHGLPAWGRFRKVAGDSVASRAMFVEMYKADPQTLMQLEKDPEQVGDSLVQRLGQLQQMTLLQANQVPLGNVITLLFVSIDEDVALPTQAHQMMSGMFQQQSFHAVIKAGPRREILTKMLGTWIKRSDDYNLNQALYLAMLHNIPEGLGLAERVLKKQGGNFMLAQPYTRQQALCAVAKFGGEKHAELIEPFLEDKTVVFQKQPNFFNETQMRDIALASLVCLARQDLKAFGFDKAQLSPETVVAIHTLGFENDEQRAAALKKWREFRAKKK